MHGALAATVLAVIVASANAKCPEASYQVTGQIMNTRGEPVAGATVMAAWRDHVGGGAKRALAGEDGSYVLDFRSSTLSGETTAGVDACESRVVSATVEVTSKSYRPVRGVVNFDNGHARGSYTLVPLP